MIMLNKLEIEELTRILENYIEVYVNVYGDEWEKHLSPFMKRFISIEKIRNVNDEIR